MTFPKSCGALAFTFDHETSWAKPKRGFVVQSKYLIKKLINRIRFKYDLSWAKGRGWGQRQGAENIFGIFKEYGIHGTWYCTGYALLSGNKEKRVYAGNPVLPYATKQNNFYQGNLWRANRGYFDDDPFTTYRENPEWYFGDQIKRFYQSGEDIQCHTFSHLYISLETPERLARDISEWQRCAEEIGLPPAESLAFPYESFLHLTNTFTGKIFPNLGYSPGNEYRVVPINHDLCKVLSETGIKVITRIPDWFWKEHYPPFDIARMDNQSNLFLFPGKVLQTRKKDASEEIAYLDEIIRTKGIGSLWCHPGNVLTSDEITKFQSVVSYAKKKAEEGVLLVAPLTEIYEVAKETIQ